MRILESKGAVPQDSDPVLPWKDSVFPCNIHSQEKSDHRFWEGKSTQRNDKTTYEEGAELDFHWSNTHTPDMWEFEPGPAIAGKHLSKSSFVSFFLLAITETIRPTTQCKLHRHL